MRCPKCNIDCFPKENPDGTPMGVLYECESCEIDFGLDENKKGELKLFIEYWERK